MLIDLLATDNIANYNIKIAQVMGLHTAIYINELMNISNKANQKNKLIADKFFILDRKYITKRTTLSLEEQLAIDTKLHKVGVMQKADNEIDTIYLDIDNLAVIISSDDSEYLDKVKKKTQVKTTALPGMKMTLRQKQAEDFKKGLTITHPELRAAYEGWIDGVYANPKGFLSKRAIDIFIAAVDQFADGYLDVALNVINIATVGGYREAEWAINKYNEKYSKMKTVRKRNALVDTSNERSQIRAGEEIF